MVGDEDPVGETLPLKLTIPEKLSTGVKCIEMLAPVPYFAKNWFGTSCIWKSG